jgi:hypothetical protein
LPYISRKATYDFDNSTGPISNIGRLSNLAETLMQYASSKVIVEMSRWQIAIYFFVVPILIFLVGIYYNNAKERITNTLVYFKSLFIKRDLIFNDDFANDKGWHRRYWEEDNPNAGINIIENGKMIFKARLDDLQNKEKRYGAYYDFTGLIAGDSYEVTCLVRSQPNTTMKFQIWLHNNIYGRTSTWSHRQPTSPVTPGVKRQRIIAKFNVTETRSLRIHLECSPGDGEIYVENIKLERIY